MSGEIRKPLEGIKVVDLSNYVAAPVCSRMLADMGADVIKIETFKGDPWRETAKACTYTDDLENPVFDIYNAGKKSICLNIKHESGMAVLMEMLKEADVFITNTRARSLKKLGLDYETLHEKFPRLIYGTITGYGSKGPDTDSPGFDNVAFWTRSGFLRDMSIQSETSYPVYSPTGCGDTVTGGMLFGGIMTALYQREKTGLGDYVTTALYNASVWILASMIMQAQEPYSVKFPKERTDSSPFVSPYKCADGEWMCITVLDYARFQNKVFEILGIQEEMSKLDLPTQAAVKKHSAQIVPVMEQAFLKKTSREWLRLFKEADIVCGLMNHMSDVPKDEQAIVNQFVQEYHCRNGNTCMMPCPPIRLESQAAPLAESAPLIGEHTRQVLLNMGYAEDKIDEMICAGAVK